MSDIPIHSVDRFHETDPERVEFSTSHSKGDVYIQEEMSDIEEVDEDLEIECSIQTMMGTAYFPKIEPFDQNMLCKIFTKQIFLPILSNNDIIMKERDIISMGFQGSDFAKRYKLRLIDLELIKHEHFGQKITSCRLKYDADGQNFFIWFILPNNREIFDVLFIVKIHIFESCMNDSDAFLEFFNPKHYRSKFLLCKETHMNECLGDMILGRIRMYLKIQDPTYVEFMIKIGQLINYFLEHAKNDYYLSVSGPVKKVSENLIGLFTNLISDQRVKYNTGHEITSSEWKKISNFEPDGVEEIYPILASQGKDNIVYYHKFPMSHKSLYTEELQHYPLDNLGSFITDNKTMKGNQDDLLAQDFKMNSEFINNILEENCKDKAIAEYERIEKDLIDEEMSKNGTIDTSEQINEGTGANEKEEDSRENEETVSEPHEDISPQIQGKSPTEDMTSVYSETTMTSNEEFVRCHTNNEASTDNLPDATVECVSYSCPIPIDSLPDCHTDIPYDDDEVPTTHPLTRPASPIKQPNVSLIPVITSPSKNTKPHILVKSLKPLDFNQKIDSCKPPKTPKTPDFVNAPSFPKESPSKDVKESPSKDVKESPSKDVKAKESPSKDVKAKESPSKDVKAKESPSKDVKAKKSSSKDVKDKKSPSTDDFNTVINNHEPISNWAEEQSENSKSQPSPKPKRRKKKKSKQTTSNETQDTEAEEKGAVAAAAAFVTESPQGIKSYNFNAFYEDDFDLKNNSDENLSGWDILNHSRERKPVRFRIDSNERQDSDSETDYTRERIRRIAEKQKPEKESSTSLCSLFKEPCSTIVPAPMPEKSAWNDIDQNSSDEQVFKPRREYLVIHLGELPINQFSTKSRLPEKQKSNSTYFSKEQPTPIVSFNSIPSKNRSDDEDKPSYFSQHTQRRERSKSRGRRGDSSTGNSFTETTYIGHGTRRMSARDEYKAHFPSINSKSKFK